MNAAIGYTAIAVVAVASALIGFYGLRVSRTTSDFYVASRTVRPWWNASAIGGEYLSAASFLGIAGLILLTGSSGLWFPIGYTAGYLMLLLFVAATTLFVLAIAFVPVLDQTFVAGVPLSWLLLGVGVYPLAITVGGLYVRAATRNEARYRSLTEDE